MHMTASVAAMMALVAVSAATDIRNRLIYDAFTFPAMLAGLYFGILSGPDNFMWSVAGLAAGLLVLYPFYRIGGMGLGDLKLLGAVGALGGLPFLISAVVDTSLAGGVIAMIIMARRGTASKVIGRSPAVMRALFSRKGSARFARSNDGDTIPYGVAIAIGTVFAWLTHWPWL